MIVPEDAEELAVAHTEGGALGVWKTDTGTLLVAGYHFGPSGEVLFRINRDGSVDANDELEAAE